jgi:hypothetical protein
MKIHRQAGKFLGVALFLFGWLGSASGAMPMQPTLSDPDKNPPGPDRFKTILVQYTQYNWWLTRWSDNQVVCEIKIDHEGTPSAGDIYTYCETADYNTWIEQQACPPETMHKNPSACEGYYIYYVDSEPAEREISVLLPPPVVWVSLDGCTGISFLSTNLCEKAPVLVLSGEEPLPNESILNVEGKADGQPFSCQTTCRMDLQPTDEEGITIEFWAYSSYGDSSRPFSAQLRVAQAEEGNPDQKAWYVDVLSTQWTGQPAASCSETWGAFPPVGGPPAWLTTPAQSSDLVSSIPYSYLAGNLILQGMVHAPDCPGGGLLAEGGANSCGLEAARSTVERWQNDFDELILKVAQDNDVPARLLKNLFARESQFWPGILKNTEEVGLGQLTEGGADTTLLWNPSFYGQFCPLVLSQDSCNKGYLHLKEQDQKTLRAALVHSVNASCGECPLGLDLSQVDFSINVFAHTLLASCEQTDRIVRNVAHKAPGQVASYEDLWKFTLVNYNAGPGCLSLAVDGAWSQEGKLTWEAVSDHLTTACQGTIDYVDDISR